MTSNRDSDKIDPLSFVDASNEEMLKVWFTNFDRKFGSGLSNEEYKLRLLDIEKKQKLDAHVFDCRMRELERRRKSTELALRIFDANVNLESGIDDKSGFSVIDRRLGITSFGRKVLRLRGGASQGSDCDSDGLPGYMQNDYEGDDMEMIQARREVEDFPMLVPGAVDGVEGVLSPQPNKGRVDDKEKSSGVRVMQSSSGGIVVEDCTGCSSDEEHNSFVTDRDMLERMTVNRAVKAAYAVNKGERDELYDLRRKFQVLGDLLKKKGISMVDLEKEQIEGDAVFNSGVSDLSKIIDGRDEMGFHIFKDARGNSANLYQEDVNLKRNSTVGESSGAKDVLGNEKSSPDLAKSWSQVVNDKSENKKAKFVYMPMPDGLKVVSPPDDVLKKGNDKFKTTIVGKFTRGVVSFTKVNKFAHTMWEKKGLLCVSQKDVRTFHFKFDTVFNMNKALSRGTWYLDKQPLVMLAWGSSVGSVKTLPLWVRFDQVPDCYWTEEGLSALASSIGPPLEADELTAKLEVLPFAKMCVQYTVGNDLPSKLDVTVLDPISNDKAISTVLVSYPNKPLVCLGCKSLGHLVAACPHVSRKWVKKDKQSNMAADGGKEPSPTEDKGASFSDTNKDLGNSVNTVLPGDDAPTDKQNAEEDLVAMRDSNQYVGGWQTVRKKKAVVVEERVVMPTGISECASPLTNDSPPPADTFKNLKVVDEIDSKRAVAGGVNQTRLTKSQKKRARRALGGSPS